MKKDALVTSNTSSVSKLPEQPLVKSRSQFQGIKSKNFTREQIYLQDLEQKQVSQRIQYKSKQENLLHQKGLQKSKAQEQNNKYSQKKVIYKDEGHQKSLIGASSIHQGSYRNANSIATSHQTSTHQYLEGSTMNNHSPLNHHPSHGPAHPSFISNSSSNSRLKFSSHDRSKLLEEQQEMKLERFRIKMDLDKQRVFQYQRSQEREHQSHGLHLDLDTKATQMLMSEVKHAGENKLKGKKNSENKSYILQVDNQGFLQRNLTKFEKELQKQQQTSNQPDADKDQIRRENTIQSLINYPIFQEDLQKKASTVKNADMHREKQPEENKREMPEVPDEDGQEMIGMVKQEELQKIKQSQAFIRKSQISIKNDQQLSSNQSLPQLNLGYQNFVKLDNILPPSVSISKKNFQRNLKNANNEIQRLRREVKERDQAFKALKNEYDSLKRNITIDSQKRVSLSNESYVASTKNRKQQSREQSRDKIYRQNQGRQNSVDEMLYESIDRKSSESTFRMKKVKLVRIKSEGRMDIQGQNRAISQPTYASLQQKEDKEDLSPVCKDNNGTHFRQRKYKKASLKLSDPQNQNIAVVNQASQHTTPQTALIKMLSLDVLEEKDEQEEEGEKQTQNGFYKSATTAETLNKNQGAIMSKVISGEGLIQSSSFGSRQEVQMSTLDKNSTTSPETDEKRRQNEEIKAFDNLNTPEDRETAKEISIVNQKSSSPVDKRIRAIAQMSFGKKDIEMQERKVRFGEGDFRSSQQIIKDLQNQQNGVRNGKQSTQCEINIIDPNAHIQEPKSQNRSQLASRLQIFYEDDDEEKAASDNNHEEQPSNNQDTPPHFDECIQSSPKFEVTSNYEEDFEGEAIPSFGNTLTHTFSKDFMGKVEINNPNRDTMMQIPQRPGNVSLRGSAARYSFVNNVGRKEEQEDDDEDCCRYRESYTNGGTEKNESFAPQSIHTLDFEQYNAD